MSAPAPGCSSSGHTSRSTGIGPSAASSALVRAAENATEPVLESTFGASVTASTAVNPTPNRPTPSVLAEARRAVSACTPGVSSGAPVLATRSAPSTRRTVSAPAIPARLAASAAFWASSVSTRSR